MSLAAVLVPDDSCAHAQDIFRPLDRAAVPELAHVIAWLEVHDPDVLAAVADVDRSLIWAAMKRSPLEHLEICTQMMADLTAFRQRATCAPVARAMAQTPLANDERP